MCPPRRRRGGHPRCDLCKRVAAGGNSTWTESGVNWNNAGYTLGTKYATASPSYNQKTVYNITNLVKAWKNGSETAACGFVLKSTNETSVDKAFLSSEYATTASRPCVKLTYTSEVSLNSTSFAIDEGSSRTLTATTSDGGTVTWSSSNTTVATVTSGGRVTGVKAGKATITATMTDGTSASSVVYVTIADGVYRIKSSSIGLYLGTYGSIAENTSARMLAYSNEGLTQLQQLWKITYIASGYYSIRPMHKLDMTLHANGTSGSSVDIVTSGTTDTPSSILAVNCWGICVTSDGTAYNINHINTSSLGMRYADGATSPGLGVITAVNSGTASSFNWALEMAQGVFLYDSTYSLPDAANPVEIELGKTQTLSELGVTIEFNEIDGYTWSSNSPTCIAVDENTGDVTALKRGDATLTFTAWSGAAEYTAQVYIASIETIYVKNYYDSTVAGNTEVIQNISIAVGFLDIVYRDEFNLRFVMNGSPEQYNDAAVDICDNGDRHYCTYSNETNCSALCTGHHKNVHRIANELYPSVSNTVVVMWSNCKEGIYCESLDGVHITKEIELALVTFEEVGNMRMHAPVVQFLTINQNQLIRDYGSDDVFMAIILAHEIAHTLGVNDVYNNSYYPDVTVHTNYASVQCIMAYFDQANAENFYQSIQNGTSAFCTDCIELLHSEMVENVYEN